MTEETVTYRFSGPQPGSKDLRTLTKGIMRKRRAQKRKEAEARNVATPIERTRRFRLYPDEFGEDPKLGEREDERVS
jgi:hypothetical protein